MDLFVSPFSLDSEESVLPSDSSIAAGGSSPSSGSGDGVCPLTRILADVGGFDMIVSFNIPFSDAVSMVARDGFLGLGRKGIDDADADAGRGIGKCEL